MSAALIGIICLQIYWISWSIRLNEEQFDKNIFSALGRVADKLEYYENISVIEALQSSKATGIFWSEASKNIDRAAKFLENGYSMRRISKRDSLAHQNRDTPAFEESVTAWEYMKVSQLVDSKPLAERIQLDLLGQSLHDELAGRGIHSPYQYGVYAKARNSFVIANNHFVVVDNGPQVQQGGSTNLYNSPYRVPLFQQDIESPGFLTLYFPNRTQLVLGSIWKTLALSVLFTGIIMFCFWYTIGVIFKQKKLSEMKTDFINNMTHEFKTPIATISLAADSISNPMILSNPDKIKRFIDIIRQENRRMNSQVERVLQVAVIDKKDYQLRLGPINLHELIQQAVGNFSLQIENREGALHLELNASNFIIEGDTTHIASVIHNLLDNANKYSPNKPEIFVRTRNLPMGVEVSVQDNGIGIGKEARKHIFDKFYRVHTGNLHDVKGFGLGLSYVKAIMTAHKGFIDVRSESGKGSTFLLTFPYKLEG